MLGAVAAGGVVGAEARYGLTALVGEEPSFPWATLGANITGCFLVGVLMVVLLELTAPHRLLRPFLGVGVLGGYTTFSAYAVEIHEMLLDDRALAAWTYLAVTPMTALLAAWLGTRVTRGALARRRHRSTPAGVGVVRYVGRSTESGAGGE